MNPHPVQYLIFALFIVIAASYSLPGDWKLKNIDGEATDKEIVLRITEIVTHSGEIKNSLNFSNCGNIVYQVTIKQNFMSMDKVSTNNTTSNSTSQQNSQCTQQQSKLEKRISQTLKKVFFFAIKSDLLVFVSPNGNDLFQFSRIQKIYLTNLTGTWFLDQIYWERASNSEVQVKKQNFTFCDGKLAANFTTNNIDEINFDIIKNQNCSQSNLTKALGHIRYYRINEDQLQFFNQYSVEVMQLIFKSGDGLKEQQKILTNSTGNGSVTIIQNDNPVKIDLQVEGNLRTEPNNSKTTV